MADAKPEIALECVCDSTLEKFVRVWSDENYHIHEIAEAIACALPECRVEVSDDAGPDKRAYRMSLAKIAASALNYARRRTGEPDVTQLYYSYLAAGMAPQDFEGSRSQRTSPIRWLMADGTLNDDPWRLSSRVGAALTVAAD